MQNMANLQQQLQSWQMGQQCPPQGGPVGFDESYSQFQQMQQDWQQGGHQGQTAPGFHGQEQAPGFQQNTANYMNAQ